MRMMGWVGEHHLLVHWQWQYLKAYSGYEVNTLRCLLMRMWYTWVIINKEPKKGTRVRKKMINKIHLLDFYVYMCVLFLFFFSLLEMGGWDWCWFLIFISIFFYVRVPFNGIFSFFSLLLRWEKREKFLITILFMAKFFKGGTAIATQEKKI